MKSQFLSIMALFCVLIQACQSNSETEKVKDSVNDATEKVEKAVENTVDQVKEKMDESFVKSVLDDNAEGLEWLNAGVKMGTDKELVGVALEMIPDHEKLADYLKDYATRRKIKVDVDNDGVKIDSKTGVTWDADWATKMRKFHRDLIDRFERVQTNAEDPELKDFATTTLPTLRNHLDKIEQLEVRLDKKAGRK